MLERVGFNMENHALQRKIINVTGKRQITIPLQFFEKLRFGKEIECVLAEDAVVLRPLSYSDDSFTMEILSDLISQGYGGNELLIKFAEQRSKIKGAINTLIEEADEIASGKRKGATCEDIFREE